MRRLTRRGLSRKPDVTLMGMLRHPKDAGLGPEEISEYGALGCFDERTPIEIYRKDRKSLSGLSFESKKEKIFDETSGRGQGPVLDQNCFALCVKDIPRLATAHLCQPQYLMHLGRSHRRTAANRGMYLPQSIIGSKKYGEAKRIMKDAFSLYADMEMNGVPMEDARYVLPLYSRINLLTTGNAREFMHLHSMSRKDTMPAIIRDTLELMIGELCAYAPKLFKERMTNYEPLAWYPSAQLFSEENVTLSDLIQKYPHDRVALVDRSGISMDRSAIAKAIEKRDEAELANLKHMHYTFLARMSMVTFQEAIMQRTWDQSVEPIYTAAERGEFTIAPSMVMGDRALMRRYEGMNERMHTLYKELIAFGVPAKDAIGVLPQSLMIYDLIHVNGWNAIHSIGKRTCSAAQWEISNMAKEIERLIQGSDPDLGRYVQPQGVNYGRCPEKNPCGKCGQMRKSWGYK